MSEPFLGQLLLVPYNFAPRGWAFCSGQLLPIAQNTALFSLLGTTYGGNGQTTFALPDLRGRTALSSGQGPGLGSYDLGEVSGTENVTILQSNMPPHNHLMNVGSATKVGPGASGNIFGGADIYVPGPPDTVMSPQSIGISGSGIPISILQPFLVLNYIIAMEGIFPSRN
jgi:microcystin-dependent protein